MGPFPSYLSRSVPVYVFGFNEMEKKGVGLDVITFDMNTIVQLTLDDVLDKNWGAASRTRKQEIHAAWQEEQRREAVRLLREEELAKKTGDSSQCPSHGRSFPGSAEGYGGIYRPSLDLRQIGGHAGAGHGEGQSPGGGPQGVAEETGEEEEMLKKRELR